jgi:hypothetical protein
MSITLIVLVVEVIVILLVAVGFLFFLPWKRSKAKTIEFERLLDNIASKEDERKAQLIQFLEESHALKTEAAEESAGYMVEAEKQFLQYFIKQQLEQTPVNDFHENLCELLDQYLYFVPTINIEQHAPNAEKPEQQNVVEIEASNTDTDTDTDEDIAIEEPEVKNSGEMEPDKEEQATESEQSNEEELDWGAAFAESGDDMDEETKAGFESEKKAD